MTEGGWADHEENTARGHKTKPGDARLKRYVSRLKSPILTSFLRDARLILRR